MYDIESTTEEKVKVVSAPGSAGGGPAPIDGALRITVQSGDATFTQDPEKPQEFYAVSAESAGVTDFLVEADAKVGEGEVIISEVVRYTYTGPQAANFGFSSSVEPK